MPQTDIIRIVKRRGWIVILLVLLTMGAAYGFSKSQRTLYRSTVVVWINPARTDFGLAQTAKLLLANYTTFIDTEETAQHVIDGLKLDMQAGDLKQQVTIDPDELKLTITIAVKDADPAQANAIAFNWAQQLVDWRNSENQQLLKEDRINAKILDQPKAALYQPQTKINLAAGAVLGLLLGAALVFALEWVESGIVRTPADLERFIGVTALGVVPHTRATSSRRRPASSDAAQAARRPA